MISCKNCLNFKTIPVSKLEDRYQEAVTVRGKIVANCILGHIMDMQGQLKKFIIYNMWNKTQALNREKCEDFVSMDDDDGGKLLK